MTLNEISSNTAFDILNSENSNVSKVLTNLKHELKLNNLPNHIECFDISNTVY